MRLTEEAAAYLSVKETEGYSPYTIRAYRLQIHLLARDIGDIEAGDVTLQMLRGHMAKHTHLKPASIGHKVRAFRSFFRWLAEEERIAKNPTLRLREPKLPPRIPKALTLDEVETLRDACSSPFEHALVEFFFASGCRIGEVHRIDRRVIDTDRRAVMVLGKGGKEREVYYGARCAIWLRRYLATRHDDDAALFVTERNPHRRVSIHQVQYVFKRIAKRCGLEARVTPHVLRHTYGTFLLNQGAPLAAVQTLMGHSKPTTTQLYAQLSGTERQRAYERYFVQ